MKKNLINYLQELQIRYKIKEFRVISEKHFLVLIYNYYKINWRKKESNIKIYKIKFFTIKKGDIK